MKQTFTIQTLPYDPEAPLRDILLALFPDGDQLKINVYPDEISINWSAMYEAPGIINPRFIFTLCHLFGTDNVDVDGFSESGCDTCDYGSSYGHVIDIKGATQNLEAINELNGLDLKNHKKP